MLGNYLKNYRIKNNLSQNDIAKKIGTSQAYYNQIERGKKKPGIKLIGRISNFLNIDPLFIRSLL